MNIKIGAIQLLFLTYSGVVFFLTFIIGLFADVSFFVIILRSFIFTLLSFILLFLIVKLVPYIFPNLKLFSVGNDNGTEFESKTIDLDADADLDAAFPSQNLPNANLQVQSYSNAGSSVNIVLDDNDKNKDNEDEDFMPVNTSNSSVVTTAEQAKSSIQSVDKTESNAFQSTIDDPDVPKIPENDLLDHNIKTQSEGKTKGKANDVDRLVKSRERVHAQKSEMGNGFLNQEIEKTRLEFESSPENVSKAVASWIKNDDNSK